MDITNMTDETLTIHESLMDHDVIVFSKQQCHKCEYTIKAFQKQGITPKVIMLDDPLIRLTDCRYATPLEFAKSLGVAVAPLVLVRAPEFDNDTSLASGHSYWSDARPDLIKAASHALTKQGL